MGPNSHPIIVEGSVKTIGGELKDKLVKHLGDKNSSSLSNSGAMISDFSTVAMYGSGTKHSSENCSTSADNAGKIKLYLTKSIPYFQ